MGILGCTYWKICPILSGRKISADVIWGKTIKSVNRKRDFVKEKEKGTITENNG
jgi:hypothetical protein